MSTRQSFTPLLSIPLLMIVGACGDAPDRAQPPHVDTEPPRPAGPRFAWAISQELVSDADHHPSQRTEQIERSSENHALVPIARTTWSYREDGVLEIRDWRFTHSEWEAPQLVEVTRVPGEISMTTTPLAADMHAQTTQIQTTPLGDSTYAEGVWSGPGPNVGAIRLYGADWR